MSSNEIANHLEAIAWVRNGPAPGEGGIDSIIQYIRSQNGFEDRLGVFGGEGQTPALLLYLDRQYSRDETAVFVTAPTTGDSVVVDGTPLFTIYPVATLAQIRYMPVDRRIFDPSFVPPTDPYELALLYERYDSIAVTPQDIDGDPVFTDFCVAVTRIPRKQGTTTYTIIETP